MARVRVLHWCPNYLGGGGVASAVLGVANAQARQGTKVAIAAVDSLGKAMYGSMREPLLPAVDLIAWRPALEWRRGTIDLRWVLARTRHELAAWQPDVVHIHGGFNLDNLWVPFLFSCPFVLSHHGAFHPVVIRKTRRMHKWAFLKIAKRLLISKSILHSMDPADLENIQRLFPGLPAYMATNGPSMQTESFLLSSDPNPAPKSGEVKFVFVGRLDLYTKGLDLLLEALAQAVGEMPDCRCRLTLVGPDWKGSRALLEQQTRNLGLDKQVDFAGTQTGRDLVAMVRRHDVYIQVSRHEGNPIALAEALLCGKPAILSNRIGTVSYPEIAKLPYVRLVQPFVPEIAGAIVKAVRQIDELRTAAQRGLPALRHFFSWDTIASRHLDAYRQGLARKAGGNRR